MLRAQSHISAILIVSDIKRRRNFDTWSFILETIWASLYVWEHTCIYIYVFYLFIYMYLLYARAYIYIYT